LPFYNPAHPTSLHVDASRLRGLGFILLQQQTNGSWNVVQAGSRFLSDGESRYAMIELVFGCGMGDAEMPTIS
jgi:hypothetical protein